MPVSNRAFRIGLYDEYLEEACFLYVQRRTLYRNAEVTWKGIGEFEERLEAHLDGLVVGGALGVEVCERRAAEGDPGELFAAVRVFCRQKRQDLVLAALDRLDPGDAEKTNAVSDALKDELPDTWVPDFLALLSSGDPKLVAILARTFGYRRVPGGPQLLSAMTRCPAKALPDVVWALGRIAHRHATGPLLDMLRNEDEPVRSAAALSLARIGEPRSLDECLAQVREKAWPRVPLGLAGGPGSVPLLNELASRGGDSDSVTALGLLGDPTCVPTLISALEDPQTVSVAADALQCLTGAGIHETVFVPEDPEDGELLDSEQLQRKAGKLPVRADGRPFGTKVTRLSRNPGDWRDWWHENEAKFTRGVRYRQGRPLSPKSLLEILLAEDTPHELRKYSSEELVTRYGRDAEIEVDMPAVRQLALLSGASEWCDPGRNDFQDGGWYFAGHPIE